MVCKGIVPFPGFRSSAENPDEETPFLDQERRFLLILEDRKREFREGWHLCLPLFSLTTQ
jgi:hypothetical protein